MDATPRDELIASAEQSVLGALLLDNGVRTRCNALSVRDFSAEQHRIIYRAIVEMIDGGKVADAVTVYTKLRESGESDRAGGLPYLNVLASNTPSAANVAAYAELVHRAANQRRRVALYGEAQKAAARGDSGAEASIFAELDRAEIAPTQFPDVVDLGELAATDPQPPPFIVPGWLPQGEVTLLASHGGAGKSFIALYLAVCIATGKPFFGLPVQRRKVAFLSCEDGRGILHWRLSRICAWLGVAMADLSSRLALWDQSSGDGALMHETREGLRFTDLHAWVAGRLAGFEVFIVDGASDTFDGDEIKRRQVRRFVRELRRLIPDNGAVLLLAHVNASTARNPETAQGFSGSTAWHNSVRARWYLREDDGALLLETQKGNHSGGGHSMRLRWNDEAHVFVGELQAPATPIARGLRDADEREAVLALIVKAHAEGSPLPSAARGVHSAHKVAEARGLPEALRGKRGKERFYDHLIALEANNAIKPGTVKTGNRNYKAVYVPAASATERASATAHAASATERGASAMEH